MKNLIWGGGFTNAFNDQKQLIWNITWPLLSTKLMYSSWVKTFRCVSAGSFSYTRLPVDSGSGNGLQNWIKYTKKTVRIKEQTRKELCNSISHISFTLISFSTPEDAIMQFEWLKRTWLTMDRWPLSIICAESIHWAGKYKVDINVTTQFLIPLLTAMFNTSPL